MADKNSTNLSEGQKFLLMALMTSKLIAVTYCRDKVQGSYHMEVTKTKDYTFYYETPLGKGIVINFCQSKTHPELGYQDSSSIFPCLVEYIPQSEPEAIFELSLHFGSLVNDLFL